MKTVISYEDDGRITGITGVCKASEFRAQILELQELMR
jgi:hypothetical protein